MLNLVKLESVEVLKGVLIETIKDVPGIHKLEKRSIDAIVEKIDEHTQNLFENINKLKEEIRLSRRTDSSEMMAELLRKIKQKNTFILALNTILRDKYQYVDILNEF